MNNFKQMLSEKDDSEQMIKEIASKIDKIYNEYNKKAKKLDKSHASQIQSGLRELRDVKFTFNGYLGKGLTTGSGGFGN